MAVEWQTGTSANNGTITTATMNVSHTVAAGSDRAIYAVATTYAASGGLVAVNSVTRNGQSFTKILDITIGTTLRYTIWRLVAPTVGTFNIAYNFSRTLTTSYSVQAHNFTGVDQVTPESTIDSDSGTGATTYSASVSGSVPFLFQSMFSSDAGSSYWALDTANATTDVRASSGASLLLIRSWTIAAAPDPYTADFSHLSATSFFYSAVPINAADTPPPPANPVTNSAAASLLNGGVYKSVARNFVASMLVTDVFSGQVFHGLGFSPDTISVTLRSASGASAIGSRLTLLSWDATVAVFGYVVAGVGTVSAVNDIYFSREHSIVR